MKRRRFLTYEKLGAVCHGTGGASAVACFAVISRSNNLIAMCEPVEGMTYVAMVLALWALKYFLPIGPTMTAYLDIVPSVITMTVHVASFDFILTPMKRRRHMPAPAKPETRLRTFPDTSFEIS